MTREYKTNVGVEITRKRTWYSHLVYEACVRNKLYTRGDNAAYTTMLGNVERSAPTTEAMYMVAKDICEHSKDQTITNILYILESEAVITTFLINGEEDT
jgi:hypothetical protein